MAITRYLRGIIIGLAIVFLIVLAVTAAYYPYSEEVPQELKVTQLPEWARKVFSMLGLPANWLWFPAIIYFFFVPFIGIFAILIGFLSTIGIFNDRINLVLALVFTLVLIPLGYFTRIAAAMFATLGMYSVAAFLFLFFFGVIGLVLDRLYEWGFTSSPYYTSLVVEGKYESLREWFRRTMRDNARVTDKEVQDILQKIADELGKADKKWEKGNRAEAFSTLEKAALKYYNELRKKREAKIPVYITKPPKV